MRHDRHVLYEAAVQGVDYDLDFFQRIHRQHVGRRLLTVREDFCGTAALACAWARRSAEHRAWGVDLDPSVLAWAHEHRFPRMRDAVKRVTLVRGDVRRARTPRADLVCALNFSYWVFRERRDLLAYFRAARANLVPGGMFVCNAFGGTGAMETLVEKTRIPSGRSAEGDAIPAFTYVWEQTYFNPIDHHVLCDIHFRLRDGEMRRTFHYDWRLWTLPELRDALHDAGFTKVHAYIESWDERNDRPAEHYRLRRQFENQLSWLAYLVSVR